MEAEDDIHAKLSSDIASGLANHIQQSLDSGTTAKTLSYTWFLLYRSSRWHNNHS